MDQKAFAMLADYYEFTMAYNYFKENRHHDIVYFDVFTRKHPDDNGYIIFNGLESVIEAIKNFKFTESQIDFLRESGLKDETFLDYLRHLKLSLTITAPHDGTVMFKGEPLMTVSGPLLHCQLVETLILLSVNFPTLISTKTARIVQAAQGRSVMEFGARRAQSYDASIEGARAAVLAGADSTSNAYAAMKYQLPVSGTMAHSFVQLHETEYEAFLEYCKVQPENTILLVDTYDTLKSGVPNAIKVALEYLIPRGYRLKGIRLDSGDLSYLSKQARQMLDEAGLNDAIIVASNSLNEELIDGLLTQEAKIDAFGVGENLITSASSPVIGGVYKLVARKEEETIVPVIKLSDNIEKITNPGYKKVVRFYDQDTNKALADYIYLQHETVPTDTITIFDPLAPWKRKTLTNYTVRHLHETIFEDGLLTYKVPSMEESIDYCKAELQTLWPEVKRLRYPHKYYVDLSQELYDLKNELLAEKRNGY